MTSKYCPKCGGMPCKIGKQIVNDYGGLNQSEPTITPHLFLWKECEMAHRWGYGKLRII